jgi:hypothetical protein
LLRIFKELKSRDVWNTLQDHWNSYQKKHYAREENLRKNVRQVTKMTGKQDEDEIDDVEEASVDDDSPPLRNRQRLSC